MAFNRYLTVLILIALILVAIQFNSKVTNAKKHKRLKLKSNETFTAFHGRSSPQQHGSIWFTREPNNIYVIDPLNQREENLQIDCSIDTNKHMRAASLKKFTYNWLKDDIYLENKQHSDMKGQNLYQEILSNGSLKLTITSQEENKPPLTDEKPTIHLELVSIIQCIANDSFGKILSRPSKIYRLNSVLSNDSTNKFIRQPENTTLYSGKQLMLKCKPNITQALQNVNQQLSNQVNYQWFKNNKLLPINSKTVIHKDGTLEITKVTEQDSGSYKCMAKFRKNLFESKQAIVRVLIPPNENKISTMITNKTTMTTSQPSSQLPPQMPLFYLWPEDKSIQEGDEVIFECLASNDNSNSNSMAFNNGGNLYRYRWLKDGVALSLSANESSRKQIVNGNNLKLVNISESDSGSYTCQVCSSLINDNYLTSYQSSSKQHDINECDERSGVLKVLVPPRFIKSPHDVNATLKSEAEFECNAYGVPAPTIQWFKNGEPIYPSEYFQFSSNQGKLKILGIINQDEGYYQCLASNELNTIQSIAQLTVIRNTSGDYYDDYHDSHHEYDLENNIGLNNKASAVKFKKATSVSPPLYDESDFTARKSSSSSSSTSKTNTMKASIELSAPVNLRLVKAKSRSLQLEWQQPAIIRSNDPKFKLNAANQLTYWVNLKPKNMVDRQREINITRTSITIDELTADTSYFIQVYAMVMESVKSPVITLEAKTDIEAKLPGPPVDFKAEFIDLSLPSQSLSTSPTLRFKWRKPAVNANNIIKYRLYYKHMNYGPVDSAVDAADDSSNFDSIGGSDYPQSSSFGDFSAASEMNNPDYDLSSSALSAEKYLDIDIPSEIAAATKPTNSDSSPQNAEQNYYEFLLEDLLKYSTYRFRLVALDKESLSLISLENDTSSSADGQQHQNFVELIIETPSDVPDGPPEALQIETINTTAIMVQWQPPLIEKRNGLIVGYKVAVKENEKQVWNINVDSEPTQKLISGLNHGQKYSVRVTAKTINGSGPASEWIIAETFSREMDETRPPGKPINLLAEPTDKSIVIQWTPPIDSGKILIRKYLLKFGIGFPDNEILLPSNRNSYIINNLIPSSQYVLSLRAINNAGYSIEILKDVITKRKSALGENENLFPPLNVQAVAISSQSIEVRWTDWHLKPEEMIPDDRYYLIRYNVAEQTNTKYKFKNATERNVIVSDLKPNTLYDFSVRLVIGRRESDWSMTTSQMTMEASPGPRDIDIKSDLNAPTSVIITWQAPSHSSSTSGNNGYIISYLDEMSFKENPNNKWKQEYINSQQIGNKQHMSATIRKLKLNTIYYFKIQARNNRAYGSPSPTIIFKMPNSKGEGGGKIFIQDEQATSQETTTATIYSIEQVNSLNANNNNNQNDSAASSSSSSSSVFIFSKHNLEMNLIWIVVASVSSLFVLVFILLAIFVCKRASSKDKKNASVSSSTSQIKKGKTLRSMHKNEFMTINQNNNSDDDDDDEVSTTYLKHSNNPQQQQKLLSCNTAAVNYHSHGQPSGWSNTESTLIIGHSQSQQPQPPTLLHSSSSRTPSHHPHSHLHHNHHHHQPLQISNPNHMMMTLLSTNSSKNNNNNNNSNQDVDFYAATNPQATSVEIIGGFNADTFYNHQNHHQNQNNDDRFSQITVGGAAADMNSADLTNTSAAIAAANAAFNAPLNHANLNVNNNSNLEQQSFMRQTTIRPKPIAIPLLNTNSSATTSPSPLTNNSSVAMNNNEIQNHQQNLFISAGPHRKSFKNLPIATATLISSNSQQQQQHATASNQHLNMNESSMIMMKQNGNNSYCMNHQQQQQQLQQSNNNNSQKIHYTARPYIIDNQVQPGFCGSGDYSNHHSPSSSHSHSSSHPPVYDKIGNVINNNVNSSKSLLQPLKSFGNAQIMNTGVPLQPSSVSIPNTPAKYCCTENNNGQSNFINRKMISIGSGSTKIANNKSSDVLMLIGKSVENIYGKNFTTTTTETNESANDNAEELTAEMANLEGIMKDLSAITAQQFEC